MAQKDGYILIPRWLAKSVNSLALTLIVAAAGFGWKVNADLAAIKAQLRAATELRASEISDIRRQIARLEQTCRRPDLHTSHEDLDNERQEQLPRATRESARGKGQENPRPVTDRGPRDSGVRTASEAAGKAGRPVSREGITFRRPRPLP